MNWSATGAAGLALAVILGAFGAHALRGFNDREARVDMGENAEAEVAPGLGFPVSGRRGHKRSHGGATGGEEQISTGHDDYFRWTAYAIAERNGDTRWAGPSRRAAIQ